MRAFVADPATNCREAGLVPRSSVLTSPQSRSSRFARAALASADVFEVGLFSADCLVLSNATLFQQYAPVVDR